MPPITQSPVRVSIEAIVHRGGARHADLADFLQRKLQEVMEQAHTLSPAGSRLISLHVGVTDIDPDDARP